VTGDRKITSLTGKEHELVEESMRYSLDVVYLSSIKRGCFHTVELDDWWKLFYSVVETAKFPKVGVRILASPRLTSFVDEWILLGGRLCMLALLDLSMCLIQAYGADSNTLYLEFSWKKLMMPCED